MPFPIRSFSQYRAAHKLGKGAFSTVYAGTEKSTGATVAIKCLNRTLSKVDILLNTVELKAAERLKDCPYVVKVQAVIHDKTSGHTGIVQEKMKQCLLDLIEERKQQRQQLNISTNHYLLSKSEIKSLAYQLICGVGAIHEKGIIHRDLKPENILVKQSGKLLEGRSIKIKIADFGSSAFLDHMLNLPVKSVQASSFDQNRILPFTGYVSTRWYRSPECLLSNGRYFKAIDLWAVGCVLYEMFTGNALFPGTNELDQIAVIHSIQGFPSNDLYHRLRYNSNFPERPSFGNHKKASSNLRSYISDRIDDDEDLVDLLCGLLRYDPSRRFGVNEALSHRFFTEYNLTGSQKLPIPTAVAGSQPTSETSYSSDSLCVSDTIEITNTTTECSSGNVIRVNENTAPVATKGPYSYITEPRNSKHVLNNTQTQSSSAVTTLKNKSIIVKVPSSLRGNPYLGKSAISSDSRHLQSRML